MTESVLVSHSPCPECGSSDANAVYDDGHTHCFSCGVHVHGNGSASTEVPVSPKKHRDLLDITPTDLPSRKISESVCRSNGYGVSRYCGETVQVANYCDETGAVVAQKVRTAAKEFSILGDSKAMRLWPMHRFRGGGKRLLICEGEIDLLAWQTLSGDRFPAVSVPNGAAGAKVAISKSLDWVESFQEVVLCFDNDEAGRKATAQVCEMLTPGKAHVMHLPSGCKDICEASQKGHGQALIDAFWQATPKRPDGIVGSADILKALLNPPQPGVDYPWSGLTQMLKGIRRGELVTLTAGTGVGKSLVAGLIAHHLVKLGHKIGYISLEESLTRTAERLVAAELRRPLHVSREGVTNQQLAAIWQDVFEGRVVVFNHFGSMDAETLLARIRYMRVSEGADFIVLDHLSILVSGWDSEQGDERRLIDNVMTTLRSICEQTGVGMLLISHLRAPDTKAKSHEEGGRPKLNELRGSKSISQLSDAVIAIARDQMGDDQHTSGVWVLKNRFVGQVGLACHLQYDPETGTMTEVERAEGSDYGF